MDNSNADRSVAHLEYLLMGHLFLFLTIISAIAGYVYWLFRFMEKRASDTDEAVIFTVIGIATSAIVLVIFCAIWSATA